MDITKKLYDCVEGFDKELILSHLSILQLCKENSIFSGLLSDLTEYCLNKSQGKNKCSIETFVELINKVIQQKTESILSQEYLFVDCVHANHETFRVFPGNLRNFQNQVNRLFNIIAEQVIVNKDVNLALSLLSISDTIAAKMSLSRYEIGNPDTTSLFVPDKGYLSIIEDAQIIKKELLKEILQKHDNTIDDFQQFVLSLEAYNPEGDNSSLRLYPFMLLTSGDYLLLRPSALLSAALGILLTAFYDENEKEWFSIYKNEILQDIIHTKALFNFSCMGRGEIDEQPSLLYRVDKDKILCIQTILKPEILDSYRIINEGVYKYLKERYNNFDVNVILTFDILGMQSPCVNFGENDVIILPVDDLETILNTSEISPLDLWYYIEDRKNSSIRQQGQEIDMFAFYYNNQRTFYCNIPIQENIVLAAPVGNALQLRYKNSIVGDLHFLDLGFAALLLERFPDLHSNLPIYVPYRDTSKNTFVGEYKNGHFLFSIQNNQYSALVREIAKSIILWTFCIEYKTKSYVLNTNITVGLSVYEGATFRVEREVKSNGVVIFKYYIPLALITDFSQSNVEQHLLCNLLKGLMEYNVLLNPKYNSLIEYTFSNCSGHIFQGSEHFDALLNQDGVSDLYFIDKRSTDRLLQDISKSVLNNYPRETLLSIEESKQTALKILSYVEDRMKCLLSNNTNEILLMRLFELHHALQQWKQLLRDRFNGISSFLANFGLEYSDQVSFAQQYSETDNAVCFLIENITRYNYTVTDTQRISYDDFNMLFACADELYMIGQYLDVLNLRQEYARLEILVSGRFCFPLEEMNLYSKYFEKLRQLEFNDSKLMSLKMELIPEYQIDTENYHFKSAFFKEFGLEYDTYLNILYQCVNYSINYEIPICVMPEEEFSKQFFNDANHDNYYIFKKHFVLSKESASNLQHSEFWPHRYNRAFQLSTRPWIYYNNKIWYSYKSLLVSFKIYKERLSTGAFRAKSKEMTAFQGKLREDKGSMFNKQMCLLFEHAGGNEIKVFQSIKIGKNEKLKNKVDLGDIDLLLINPNQKKIICIELKNYTESRTLWSFLNQNRESNSDLKQVLKRDKWCKSHICDFNILDNDVNEDYSLKTVFLTNNIQTYKYIQAENSEITLMEVSDILDAPLTIFNIFDNSK